MMVGNEEFVPENLIHNLFFLRAEKTRQHSFKREKNVRSASNVSNTREEKLKKGHIFTNPKLFKSEEGERKKKQNSSKHFARVFLSRRRGKTRTLKTHAQNALLRKGDDDDEGRV